MIERRAFPRKEIDCFMWYSKPQNGRPKMVVTKNISAIGTMFLSQEFLPQETNVNVKLKIPNVKNSIKLEGKVVRAQATTGVHLYKIAIKFSPPSTKLNYLLSHECNKN